MRKIVSCCFSAAVMMAVAAPVDVSSVKWSQDEASHVVTVEYSLAADAIVTVEVLTNGVPMKGITHLCGDVCRMVEKGDRKFLWAAECSHPGYSSLPAGSQVRVLAWKKSDPPDYLVASLSVTNDLAYYPEAEALPFGVDSGHYRRDALVMRRIRAKDVAWRMGSPAKEKGVNKWSLERPHNVILTNDYYIGIFEVTHGQCMSLLRWSSGLFVSGDVNMYSERPKDNVSYETVRGASTGSGWPNADYGSAHAVDPGSLVYSFRQMTGLDNLDLPTEAQWEYACRAGSTAGLYSGMDVSSDNNPCPRLGRLARYLHNGGRYTDAAVHSSTGGTARAGSYLPNAWGIYDMLGNVRELCLDWHAEYPEGVRCGPVGPESGTQRIQRGGGYSDNTYVCRAGNRGKVAPKDAWGVNGFRLAMDILPSDPGAADEE